MQNQTLGELKTATARGLAPFGDSRVSDMCMLKHPVFLHFSICRFEGRQPARGRAPQTTLAHLRAQDAPLRAGTGTPRLSNFAGTCFGLEHINFGAPRVACGLILDPCRLANILINITVAGPFDLARVCHWAIHKALHGALWPHASSWAILTSPLTAAIGI